MANIQQLYRSRIQTNDPDKIAFRLVWQCPKTSMKEGTDGWVESGVTFPVEGDGITTWDSGMSFSLFSEPILQELRIDPRWRVGMGRLEGVFVGSRIWAD